MLKPLVVEEILTQPPELVEQIKKKTHYQTFLLNAPPAPVHTFCLINGPKYGHPAP